LSSNVTVSIPGSGVGVAVAVGVCVGVRVAVAVGVAVLVDVAVSVGPPGVTVGVEVPVGDAVLVGVTGVGVCVDVGVLVGVTGVGVAVGPALACTRLSKFVSHPLVLANETLVHASVQFVATVVNWPDGTETTLLGWPVQLSVTVVEPAPPLYTSTLTSRRGTTNVKLREVTLGALNDALLVVSPPHGAA
jgi:hypothetical protein